MKKIILILFCLTMLCSCNEDLSRSNAKKQIIEKLSYPQDELLRLITEDRTIYTSMTINDWKKYAELGLLTYSRFGQSNRNGGFGKVTIGGNGVRATLTEKGKKYLVKNQQTSGFEKYVQVKQAELKFDEITGIQTYEEMNVATVSYNIKRTNITLFGKANKLEEEVINKTASFVKYDDGWRIKK